jgi:pimeloyl-ACP methyl ester carboxylesterase
MPEVQVGDVQLYYEEYGQGTPLVMILGLGQDVATWSFQLAEFAQYFRVVVFDNRDAGKSARCADGYTTVTLAGDTVGLMDSLGIERAHLLGISMGGMIAQQVALRYPERVLSVILASTAASGEG